MLLSVFVGNGAQVVCMTLVALVFACLGFLSPPNRGAFMTAVLVSEHTINIVLHVNHKVCICAGVLCVLGLCFRIHFSTSLQK